MKKKPSRSLNPSNGLDRSAAVKSKKNYEKMQIEISVHTLDQKEETVKGPSKGEKPS